MFFKKTNLNFQKATTVFGYEMEISKNPRDLLQNQSLAGVL